jgi:hypothetical protein
MDEFYEALGGIKAIMAATGESQHAILNWRRRGKPSARGMLLLIPLAKRKRVTLPDNWPKI